jgi:hypothetical protein
MRPALVYDFASSFLFLLLVIIIARNRREKHSGKISVQRITLYLKHGDSFPRRCLKTLESAPSTPARGKVRENGKR